MMRYALYREVKRVPMDFNYPLNTVWHGFLFQRDYCLSDSRDKGRDVICTRCKAMADALGVKRYADTLCPMWKEYFKPVDDVMKQLCEPPVGEGYQCWETTSEGSPVSPVFETFEALCEWCAEHLTLYASQKASKDVWMEWLK